MARYEGGGSGGGGSGVTSFAGRTGAVTPASNDYATSQIHNDSGVFGTGTLSTALNLIAGAIVAATLTAAAPLSITSGTISVADISNASKGVAPAITVGNGALVANSGGTASAWSLITTSNISATAGILLSQLGQSGAATSQYIGWSGSAWVPTTGFASPANPGDNTKVPVVSAGNFVYQFVTNAQIDPAAAIAVSKLAVGTAGQALITNSGGTAAIWTNDFVATQLLTTGSFAVNSSTGFLQVGTTAAGAGQAAASGSFRVFQGFTAKGLTSLVTTVGLWDWGSSVADTLTIGSTTGTGALRLAANGPITMVPGAGTYTFRPARFDLTGLTGIQATQGTGSFLIEIADTNTLLPVGSRMTVKGQGTTSVTAGSTGGAVQLLPGQCAAGQNGNVELFGSSGSTADNSMGGGIYIKDKQAAPVGNPTNSGLYHWSETGGLPTWRTFAGKVFQITGVDSASASTGTSGALPALPAGYVGFQAMVAGTLTAVKVAVYLP